MSVADTAVLREVLGDAIDSLPELERWVFERWVIERLSFRDIGRQLSERGVRCSHARAHRIKDRAITLLQSGLEDDGVVVAWLKR